jgi:hypothetical protein
MLQRCDSKPYVAPTAQSRTNVRLITRIFGYGLCDVFGHVVSQAAARIDCRQLIGRSGRDGYMGTSSALRRGAKGKGE